MGKSKGNYILVSAGILLVFIIASCKDKQVQVEPTATQQQTSPTVLSIFETEETVSVPTLTPIPAEEVKQCSENFEYRELKEPYQRHNGQARFTLSEGELNDLLALMKIESVCIPPEFGAPMVNADWNSAEGSASAGRMLSLGFEGLYQGGGWSSGYIVYSTYDFSAGTEYDIFATPEDLEALRDNSIPDTIIVDDVPGFVRYHKSLPMGMQSLLLTHIFPFNNDYIAIINNVGHYEPEQIDTAIQEIKNGSLPDEFQDTVLLMEGLVSSIQFLPRASLESNIKGFELYMVSGLSDPRVVDKTDPTHIQLVEPPLITEDDILTYDQALHEIALTQKAYSRIINLFSVPIDVDGLPFVILVNGEAIYSGAFYTYASSLSYDGVTIMQPINDESNTISITYGYPSPDFTDKPDPRSDPRIIERLGEINKLK